MGIKVIAYTDSGTFTLADDNTDLARSNFAVNGERLLDEHGFFRADFISVFDRKNRKTTITFNTKKQHATPFDAILFACDHSIDIPALALICLEISDVGKVAQRWLKNGGISLVGIPRQLGAATWQTYRIVGGQFLKSNPNL